VTAILGTAALAFTVVFTAMLLLTAVCLLLRWLSRRQVVGVRRERLSPTPGIEPRVMAVIVAAVTAAIGRRVVVHRVHVHRGGEADRWSRAGRMDVMVSHRVGPTR
jgi:hypothetical protein